MKFCFVVSLLLLTFCEVQLSAGEVSPFISFKAKLSPEEIKPEGQNTVSLNLTLPDGYIAYVDKFAVAALKPTDLKVSALHLDPKFSFMDKFSGKKREGVRGESLMSFLVEFPKFFNPNDVLLQLTYQVCTEKVCHFPKKVNVTLREPSSTRPQDEIPTSSELEVTPSAPSGEQTSLGDLLSGRGFEELVRKNTAWAFFLSFLAGILTSFTPCIFPMIPITLAVIGSRRNDFSRLKKFCLSLFYVFGIALTYSCLGLFAASTGALFGSLLSHPVVVGALALLLLAMALGMYGAYEIQAPAFIRNRFGGVRTSVGLAGALASGLIAGLVASPCVGPVLVSILTYVAKTQDLWLGFWLLFVFAWGMGLLFLALGTFTELLHFLPKSGPWMDFIKFCFGTIMVGLAFYFVSPILPPQVLWSLVAISMIIITSVYGAFLPAKESLSIQAKLRKGLSLALFWFGVALLIRSAGLLEFYDVSGNLSHKKSSTTAHSKWSPLTEEALREASRLNKPVIIDFYADWCVACKELEEKTFSDPDFLEVADHFVLLKLDATNESPEVEKWQKQFEVYGLPTVIFIDVNGNVLKDLTLTGFEGPTDFIKRIRSHFSLSK